MYVCDYFSKLLHLKSHDCSVPVQLMAIDYEDFENLEALIHDEKVYEFLPTFLYERNKPTTYDVLNGLYSTDPSTGAYRDSFFLGIFYEELNEKYTTHHLTFVGILELYGFKDEYHKISIGCRIRSDYCGRGIATQAVKMILDYLKNETDIETITASTMSANKSSNHVLEKCGFVLFSSEVDEDWGYSEMTHTDKWIY